MKNFFTVMMICFTGFFLFSCASLQEKGSRQHGNPAVAPETPPVIPEPPMPPELIMGKGKVSAGLLASFLLMNNIKQDIDFLQSLSAFYIEEAACEGVNHDVAFSQMCLETGFLRYGGLVLPEWNNFCGLGAIGPEQPGLVFPDVQTGVRAHIQHLKAYASAEPLNGDLVDPRYRYVKLGSSPTIYGLAGTWAADKLYSEKVAAIIKRLYEFSF